MEPLLYVHPKTLSTYCDRCVPRYGFQFQAFSPEELSSPVCDGCGITPVQN